MLLGCSTSSKRRSFQPPNDILIGGFNDRIWGHGGRDTLDGGGGNDTMFGVPEDADTLRGGSGNDSAAQDAKDLYDSVEVMLV